MAREFESTVLMEYRGLSRKAGEFEGDNGERVSYTEALRFEYDEDGVTRHQDFPIRDFDQVASFDARRLEKGQLVSMTRVLVAYEKKGGERGWFETVKTAALAEQPKAGSKPGPKSVAA